MNLTERAKNIHQQWYIINAEDKILGRLAVRIADLLTGKRKTYYSHDIVCGDIVIVINAAKIKLTADKLNTKIYRWHTGYPGGLKEKSAGMMLNHRPEFLIEEAVKGMLPNNKLRAKFLKNLKVFAGENHDHSAQNPLVLNLEGSDYRFVLPVIKDFNPMVNPKKEAEQAAKKVIQAKKESMRQEEAAQEKKHAPAEKKEAKEHKKEAAHVKKEVKKEALHEKKTGKAEIKKAKEEKKAAHKENKKIKKEKKKAGKKKK